VVDVTAGAARKNKACPIYLPGRPRQLRHPGLRPNGSARHARRWPLSDPLRRECG
jgi:hypothetical protein